jgi:hypothetical protein
MNAALKKIQARVKKLRKKHPGAKFRTLQKQAGAEYRAGKLKTRRKKSAPKRKTAKAKRRMVSAVGAVKHKRTVARRRRNPKTVTVIKYRTMGRVKHAKKRRKRYVKKRVVARRRKVGGMSKGTKNALLIGGAVVLGYLLIKSMTPAAPAVTLTNPASVSSANSLVSAATAAGYSANAIASLLKEINGSTDAQVQTAAATVNSGGSLPALYQTALVTPDVSQNAPSLTAPVLTFNYPAAN